MRFSKTFILHAYMDTEKPNQICGDLQALPKRKTFPYKNDSELLLLIQQLAFEGHSELPLLKLPDENDLNLVEKDHG